MQKFRLRLERINDSFLFVEAGALRHMGQALTDDGGIGHDPNEIKLAMTPPGQVLKGHRPGGFFIGFLPWRR
jgi:hypothetical protein